MPIGYLFYNTAYIAGFAWAGYQSESKEPLIIVLIICVMAVCLDLISVVAYFPAGYTPTRHTAPLLYMGGLSIFQLFCRFLGMYLICRDYSYRGGNVHDLFPCAASFSPKTLYQRLSRTSADKDETDTAPSSSSDTNQAATASHPAAECGTDTNTDYYQNVRTSNAENPVSQTDVPPVFPATCSCKPSPLTADQNDPWRVYTCSSDELPFCQRLINGTGD
ncbi:uncharacterized protein LOC129586239 isoform X2 [Paramacrobiotus metropolitanus]|nr:uncharacterized protein LOC129586239 isoform X2 [Paramacrobiotus metropolitanus]